MISTKSVSVGCAVLAAFLLAGAAQAEEVDAQKLGLVLKADGVLPRESRLLNVHTTGNRVTVMIQRDKPADDKTAKIDGMFIARTLFNAFPNDLENVRILYSSAQGRDGKIVEISSALVKDFGAGKISPDNLIAKLQLESVQSEKEPDVVPGIAEERRLLIWQRIENLRAKGTGIKPFMTLFQRMEEKVKKGENKYEIDAGADDLEEKLAEQEEQVQLAQKTAKGGGMIIRSKANQTQGSGKAAGADKSDAKVVDSGTKSGAAPETINGMRIAQFVSLPPPTFMEFACVELEQRKDSNASKFRERQKRICSTYESIDRGRAEADFVLFKNDFCALLHIPYSAPKPAPTAWGQR